MTNFMASGKATDPCHPDISVYRQSVSFNNIIGGGGIPSGVESSTSTTASRRRMEVLLLENINMKIFETLILRPIN
jgi:hypothetical protein